MGVSGAGARKKGHDFEREIAKRWRDMGLFPNAKRGLDQPQGGGVQPDIIGTPFWVECKRLRRVLLSDINAALDQAESARDSAEHQLVHSGDLLTAPVVVHREDGKKARVSMRMDAFLACGGDFAYRFLKDYAVSVDWFCDIEILTMSLVDFESIVSNSIKTGKMRAE